MNHMDDAGDLFEWMRRTPDPDMPGTFLLSETKLDVLRDMCSVSGVSLPECVRLLDAFRGTRILASADDIGRIIPKTNHPDTLPYPVREAVTSALCRTFKQKPIWRYIGERHLRGFDPDTIYHATAAETILEQLIGQYSLHDLVADLDDFAQAPTAALVRDALAPPARPAPPAQRPVVAVAASSPIPAVIPSNYVSPSDTTHVIDDTCCICMSGPQVVVASCGHATCVPCYNERFGLFCSMCKKIPSHYTFLYKDFKSIVKQ